MGGKIDYSTYRLNLWELAAGLLIYGAASAAVSVLFFDSLIPCIFMSPGVAVLLRKLSERKRKRRQTKLLMEFRELLLSLAANMSAGYSLERAFYQSYRELAGVYGESGYITGELLTIVRGIEMSESVEKLVDDFALRTGMDDIREFAHVTGVAKVCGGNMIRMMKKMAENIGSRMEVENEIDTMVTSKRFEQNIMSAMPFGIVLYMRVCNPGYMDILYGNAVGAAFMTACLVVVALTVLWGRKIVDITV